MATTSSFAHINEKLGLVLFAPEVTAGTPNWSFTATGGSGTTVTVDTTSGNTHDNAIASAADDFFNGLQVFYLSGTSTSALQAKVYDISDFAVSGGTATFTVNTQAATPSSGDVFYVFGALKASEVSLETTPEDLPREFVRQTLDPASSEKGLEITSGSFNFELPGLATVAADGSAPGLDRMSQFLTCVGTRSTSAGEAVTGGSSTTTQVDVTDASTFSVGQHVLINNQVRRITAVDTASTPDNIVVSPALSAAPAASDLVYTGETFTPDDSGHRTHTMLFLTDDRLIDVPGCAFNIKFMADQFGALSMGQAEFDAGAYTYQDGITLDASQTTKKAIPFSTSAAAYWGTNSLCVNSFEFDLAHERQELRDTCSNIRFDVRGRAATCAVTLRDTTKSVKDDWEQNATQAHLIIAAGNSAGACVAIHGNAQVQTAAANNINDTRYWDATFAFVDDQTDAASAQKPQLTRF